MNEKMKLLFWDYPKGLGFEWVLELRPSSREVTLRCVGYPEGDIRCLMTFTGDSSTEMIKSIMRHVGFVEPRLDNGQ